MWEMFWNSYIITTIVLDSKILTKILKMIIVWWVNLVLCCNLSGRSTWKKEGFVVKKSNLDIYLKDNIVKINDFNILSWWKVSYNRYSVVAKVARDILSILISIVASESLLVQVIEFLIVIEVLLSSNTVKALICTQHLLRSPFKECKLEDILEEV